MSNIRNKKSPVVLCILDGWGYREAAEDNAISEADTPFYDSLIANNPHSLLETSGLSVGLPDGQMGNSEVGHMNIGGGRVVMQTLPRIDNAIVDNILQSDSSFNEFIELVKERKRTVHILGLMSPGGVHSHQHHISQLAKMISDKGVSVNVHAFLDGRDVPPASAIEYIQDFEKSVVGYDVKVVTAIGRYYAMDRDNRWERVKLAYDAMVQAKGEKVKSICDGISKSYENQLFDEFIKPIIFDEYNGMKDGDGLLTANFRSDRARQIITSLVDPDFNGFVRDKSVVFSAKLGLVEYSKDLSSKMAVLFKPMKFNNSLGEVVAAKGLKQLRIAETEKYAHVTFFFNSGREKEFENEERILVPSPNVPTYDLKPQMSAVQVTDELVKVIKEDKFDLIVVNYANTDMVGHTGNKVATIQAVETIDRCLDRLVNAVNDAKGTILITADHGNSEQMFNHETGQPHTSHTTNPVPFIMVGSGVKNCNLDNGSLCDIAPTILEVMGIDKPIEMTGRSLINGKKQSKK